MIIEAQSQPIRSAAYRSGVIPATSAESHKEGRMAKYSITYSCGHHGVEQLYGKMSKRDEYVSWAEGSKLCPECYAAKQAEERAEASATAAQAAQSAGLPALIGSPKQIAWAETIRSTMMAEIMAIEARGKMMQAKIEAGEIPAGTPEERIAAAKIEIATGLAACATLRQEASAKFWIEHRECSARELVVRLQKQEVAQ